MQQEQINWKSKYGTSDMFSIRIIDFITGKGYQVTAIRDTPTNVFITLDNGKFKYPIAIQKIIGCFTDNVPTRYANSLIKSYEDAKRIYNGIHNTNY